MPGHTPTHALPYPLGTERPKAADLKNLADATDTALAGLPATQSGQVTMSYGTSQVAFPIPFATTPVVMCNIASGAGTTNSYRVRAINVTPTGFTAFIIRDGTQTGTVPVDWLAVGA